MALGDIKYWRDGYPEGSLDGDLALQYWIDGYPWGSLDLAQLSISPSAIASAEAWFSPKLNLKIFPSVIATAEQWFTGSLKLLISIATIASAEAWPTPVVAGPVNPSVIASAEAWPTPNVIRGPIILPASAIASAESWPTPKVAGPIRVTTLATGETWFSPTVIGPHEIDPPVIASAQSWPTPVVAGPVNPTLIASGESWPTPFINLHQTISPAAAIPTHEAWLSYIVQNTQAVRPSVIASGEAWFAPLVQGSTQYVNSLTIRSGELWPTPVVIGGNTSIKLYLAGVDRTNPWFSPMGAGSNRRAATITSQTIGRATMTFDLIDTNRSLVPTVFATAGALLGLTVKCTEMGLTLFAGCIDTVEVDWELGSGDTTPVIVYHCTALDKASICDRRVVTGKTYAFGLEVSEVIVDIVTNFLNGEGITPGGIPPLALGQLTADLTFNYPSVTEAFNQIATLTGSVWWIDFYGVLHFSAFTDLPAAPWSISASSNPPLKLKVTESLSGGAETTGYRNKQYVVSNLNVLPGSGTGGSGGSGGQSGITESVTWASGNPGIIDQPPGTPAFVAMSLPIGRVISMTVNGNVQTVVNFEQFAGQTSTGPNDFLWFFESGGLQIGPTFGPIPVNATIVVEYIPGTRTNSTSVQAGSAFVPSNPTLGTCGSGVFEAVQQVKDVSSQSDLNALAQAILDRSGGVPKIVEYETDKPGLAVGQLQNILFPKLDLGSGSTPVSLLITGVRGTSLDAPLEFGSRFRWQITAVSNHDPGNWVTYYTRLIGQTKNPLPVLQYEVGSFVLSPGGSLGGGIVSTNPVYAARTGLLVELYAGFTDPPVNQDAVLTFTDVTTGQTLGSVTIPSGSTAQHTTEIPASSQIYIFRKDQITVEVNYINIASGAVNAGSGTAVARWAM